MQLLLHGCSQNDEKVKEIVKKSKGMSRRRLQHIYDLARTKSVCEGGDTAEKNFDPMAGDSEEMIKHTVRHLKK